MLLFARVVQTGSFTRAAAELGLRKSTVSRNVSELEDRLGVRLLQRTTRKLSLTDAGRTYYDYCARVASEVDDAERAVTTLQETPRGLLRVTAPTNAAFLGPIVADFLLENPDVQLEVFCTGRDVALVEEGYDLAIRAGDLADSTLVARSLGTVGWVLVATPAYLKKHGKPRSPDDLRPHAFVAFGAGTGTISMHFARAGESVQVALTPRMRVNDFDVVHAAVRASVGMALLPAFLCAEDLRAKRLTRVLRDWTTPSTPVHVVYPSKRHLAPKVKRFADHLQAQMPPPPWKVAAE